MEQHTKQPYTQQQHTHLPEFDTVVVSVAYCNPRVFVRATNLSPLASALDDKVENFASRLHPTIDHAFVSTNSWPPYCYYVVKTRLVSRNSCKFVEPFRACQMAVFDWMDSW
jgi:hypothetical protein